MVLARYIAREVLLTTLVVLVALLALFAFFDLIRELNDLGKGNYRLTALLGYVALLIPAHVYVVLPVAALIGTLFVLARLSEQSELTVMRASGLSLVRLAGYVASAGGVVAVATLLFGEFVAPHSDEAAMDLRLKATSAIVAREFRSGFWIKDDRSFVNIQDVTGDTKLVNLRIYEFDSANRLTTISRAESGTYEGPNKWSLANVELTRFAGDRTVLEKLPVAVWNSVLTPDMLSVLKVVPEQMSAGKLVSYIEHLRDNRQRTTRYEIALWNKALYPIAAIIMMVLAIPFAVQHSRAGGLGAKVALGILLGVGFHFSGRLFSHLGLLNDWPSAISAGLPTTIFLAMAIAGLAWSERR